MKGDSMHEWASTRTAWGLRCVWNGPDSKLLCLTGLHISVYEENEEKQREIGQRRVLGMPTKYTQKSLLSVLWMRAHCSREVAWYARWCRQC